MTSTPPPPRRIHTPPTPLHGPKFDDYEPYSPRRRSSRVAARGERDKAATPSPRFGTSPLKNASTPPMPASAIRNPRTRHNQTSSALSPPSSPNLTSKRARGAKTTRIAASPLPASEDSDTDILPEKEVHRRTSSKDSFGMLNTPAKTPRSKKQRKDVNGAARLLFGDMEPTPSRRARNANASSLDMFGILEDDDVRAGAGGAGGIQIYTDMRERVPSLGDDEEANPFLTRNAAPKTSGGASKTRTRRKSARDVDMEAAARNDEGMVYVFRGKKIFRRYEDATAPDATNNTTNDDDNLSDASIRRKAGASTFSPSRPFTRSSLKPQRLLFPSEEQLRQREEEEHAHLADEEALTDIEMPKPVVTTPIKTHHNGHSKKMPDTPPTTVKGKRVTIAITPDEQLREELGEAVERGQVDDVSASASAVSPAAATTPKPPRRRAGAFDAFQRRKVASGSSVAGGKGTKREGSPLDSGEVSSAKRTRSAAHSLELS